MRSTPGPTAPTSARTAAALPAPATRSPRARALAAAALLSLASGAVIASGTTATASSDELSTARTQPVVSSATAGSVDSLDAAVASPVAAGTEIATEPLTWTVSGPGQVILDEGAPGGSQAQLYGVGTATTTVSGAGQVLVHARASQCAAPTMAVTVDGRRVGWLEVKELPSPGWWGYRLGDFGHAEGSHRVVVQLAHEPQVEGCDTTLHVGGVSFVPASPDSRAQTWSLVGNGVYFDDLSTPGRGQAHLWSAGTTASTRVSGGGALTVYARAEACGGNPQMDVFVDGVLMGRQTVVNPFDWWSYPVGFAQDAGEHEVTVRYVHDLKTSACDRNLRVGGVAFSDAG